MSDESQGDEPIHKFPKPESEQGEPQKKGKDGIPVIPPTAPEGAPSPMADKKPKEDRKNPLKKFESLVVYHISHL